MEQPHRRRRRRTAIGSGLIISLATLLPGAGIDLEQFTYGRASRAWALDAAGKSQSEKSVPPGSNGSAAIVLLSDGQTNVGPDPQEAAKLARARYENGVADFLQVLDAERTVLAAEDQLARSETQTATALLATYKALGGGFRPLTTAAR